MTSQWLFWQARRMRSSPTRVPTFLPVEITTSVWPSRQATARGGPAIILCGLLERGKLYILMTDWNEDIFHDRWYWKGAPFSKSNSTIFWVPIFCLQGKGVRRQIFPCERKKKVFLVSCLLEEYFFWNTTINDFFLSHLCDTVDLGSIVNEKRSNFQSDHSHSRIQYTKESTLPVQKKKINYHSLLFLWKKRRRERRTGTFCSTAAPFSTKSFIISKFFTLTSSNERSRSILHPRTSVFVLWRKNFKRIFENWEKQNESAALQRGSFLRPKKKSSSSLLFHRPWSRELFHLPFFCEKKKLTWELRCDEKKKREFWRKTLPRKALLRFNLRIGKNKFAQLSHNLHFQLLSTNPPIQIPFFFFHPSNSNQKKKKTAKKGRVGSESFSGFLFSTPLAAFLFQLSSTVSVSPSLCFSDSNGKQTKRRGGHHKATPVLFGEFVSSLKRKNSENRNKMKKLEIQKT